MKAVTLDTASVIGFGSGDVSFSTQSGTLFLPDSPPRFWDEGIYPSSPRVLRTVGKCSTTEPHPTPHLPIIYLSIIYLSLSPCVHVCACMGESVCVYVCVPVSVPHAMGPTWRSEDNVWFLSLHQGISRG